MSGFDPASNRRTRVKICCIRGPSDARIAVHAGADVLGMVGPMPSGPGQIELPMVHRLAADLPPGVQGWLLSTATDADVLIAQATRAHAQALQCVAGLSPDAADRVRAALPALRLIAVLHVRGEAAIEQAVRIAPHVHAVLLDSGNPTAPTPTYGGTGNTHDWQVSRRIVEAVPKPVWLAGGLTPENVADAIAQVRPFGVDVCSKLRTAGALDPAKANAFLHAVRAADLAYGATLNGRLVTV